MMPEERLELSRGCPHDFEFGHPPERTAEDARSAMQPIHITAIITTD
jgi:hypothetical protein